MTQEELDENYANGKTKIENEIDFNMLNENDNVYIAFRERRDTILNHITELSKIKYEDNETKQDELINEAKQAFK